MPVRVGIIGKYVALPDAYLSVVEALHHGGFHHGADIEIDWIQAEEVEGLLAAGRLHDLDGIVIPGGFGERGIEGKIAAAGYAREHDIPCLGPLPRHAGHGHRLRPQRAGAHRGQLERVRRPEPAPGDRPHGGPAGHHRQGRHHAARCLRRQARARLAGGRDLRQGGGVGTPPPPLRVQPPLPVPVRRVEPAVLGRVARRSAGRVRRARRPSVLGRHPGPPGVQEPARQPGAAVPGVRRARPWRAPRGATRTSSRSTPRSWDERPSSGDHVPGERAAPPLPIDVDEFLTWLAAERGRSANTLAAYRRDLQAYWTWLVDAGVAPSTPSPRTTWSPTCTTCATGGKAPSSVARALVAVRSLHRFLLLEGLAAADPAADVEVPRVPQGLPKALTEDEVEGLIAAVVGDDGAARRDRAMLEVLYGSGLRISELVGPLARRPRPRRRAGPGARQGEQGAGRAARSALGRRPAGLARPTAVGPSSSPSGGPGGATPTPCSSTSGAAGSRGRGRGRSSAGTATGSGSASG